jgi:hypothetical protein
LAEDAARAVSRSQAAPRARTPSERLQRATPLLFVVALRRSIDSTRINGVTVGRVDPGRLAGDHAGVLAIGHAWFTLGTPGSVSLPRQCRRELSADWSRHGPEPRHYEPTVSRLGWVVDEGRCVAHPRRADRTTGRSELGKSERPAFRRCRSPVQSGEVRVVAGKEVSASTTRSSSSASARRWRRSPASRRRSYCSS